MIGGGTAGITVAARLRRRGVDDVAVIEPSPFHYYQPLWTLVGAGVAEEGETTRLESRVMPRGVRWIQDHAAEIDPESRVVTTDAGARVGYDFLVVAAGIELDWDGIPGAWEAIERADASTNYRADLAPRTWQLLQRFQGGDALFTAPTGPYKCGGAPQKAAYLAADHLRREGLAGASRVTLAWPPAEIFGVPEFAATLEAVIARYGMDVRYRHELVEVHAAEREAVFRVETGAGDTRTETLGYDFLHVVPPQQAPEFLRKSPLAVGNADPKGWVDVDAETLQHTRHPEVFALGDCAGAPASKTGAAVRKQAPVVVANLLAVMRDEALPARYDGYSSCPLVTGYGKVVLAEFDYTGRPHPTIPFVDTTRERHDMWLLKRYGLPFLYWHLMLRGLA